MIEWGFSTICVHNGTTGPDLPPPLQIKQKINKKNHSVKTLFLARDEMKTNSGSVLITSLFLRYQ